MRRDRLFSRLRALAATASLLCLAALPPAARAWGNEGHRLINRLAAETLPSEVPAFLRSPDAIREIEYLGPEPDRWRSAAEPELSAAQAPEHFIDLELADALGPLPHQRLEFEARVFASGQQPEKVGLQPWEATEVWERLKSALREYRALKAAGQDTRAVEEVAIFYAGWLGHYVGDGSQPLHTTIEYNGWVGPNPNDYTTEHDIHGQFEATYVAANILPKDFAGLVKAPEHLDDPFAQYVSYLRDSNKLVDDVYALHKAGGFTGRGAAAAFDFTTRRLAAGSQMLLNLWYTAWVDSANAVPEHGSQPTAKK